MEPGRIFATRRLDAPSLDVLYEESEVRTPHLRIALRHGRNVTTDYALVGRSVPFVVQMRRPQLSVVLAGDGRAEEGGRRIWLRPGELVVSDGGATRGGTMAYSGAVLHQLLIEWEPSVFGAAHDHALDVAKISPRDRTRLADAALRAVTPETSPHGIAEVFGILRSLGMAYDRVDPPPTTLKPGLAALNAALAAHLSALDRFPSIDELADAVRWNPRRVHRGIKALAAQFDLSWSDWRSALHGQRLLNATRLLAAPGATTEAVARLAGFRSATSLCHAFAEAGLPSPGTLARAARSAVLETWADIGA